MIWAVPLLVVAGLAVPGVWAWYMSGRILAATTEAEQWRAARLALAVSAGVGVVILVLGVVFFVLSGYDWVVLAGTWSFGLLHLGLLTWVFRRAHRRTGRRSAAR
jgi:hypothetical protein